MEEEAATTGSGMESEEAEVTAVEEATDIVHRLVDGVRDTITVRNVYGDPVEAHGVTVIPVAQTYFGFGAGAGSGRGRRSQGAGREAGGGGGGGGGGGVVRPIGFIEITAAGARWVPIVRPWQRMAMMVVPPLIALLAGRALRRRKAEAEEG
jgi:uncharacterized spore protein YtfJ